MTDSVRIDKWLWASRFFKTRGKAREAIVGGKVRLKDILPAMQASAEAGIRQILEWGVDNVCETIEFIADRIVEQLRPLGLTALPKSERAPHYLGMQMESGLPPDLLPRLAKRKVYVSVRGSSIRITPHLYNTGADIDRLVEALQAVLG